MLRCVHSQGRAVPGAGLHPPCQGRAGAAADGGGDCRRPRGGGQPAHWRGPHLGAAWPLADGLCRRPGLCRSGEADAAAGAGAAGAWRLHAWSLQLRSAPDSTMCDRALSASSRHAVSNISCCRPCCLLLRLHLPICCLDCCCRRPHLAARSAHSARARCCSLLPRASPTPWWRCWGRSSLWALPPTAAARRSSQTIGAARGWPQLQAAPAAAHPAAGALTGSRAWHQPGLSWNRCAAGVAFVWCQQQQHSVPGDAAASTPPHAATWLWLLAVVRCAQVLFAQQLILFAPGAVPTAKHLPLLLLTLSSSRPALRRAAAATLRHLADRDAAGLAQVSDCSVCRRQQPVGALSPCEMRCIVRC